MGQECSGHILEIHVDGAKETHGKINFPSEYQKKTIADNDSVWGPLPSTPKHATACGQQTAAAAADTASRRQTAPLETAERTRELQQQKQRG